MELKELVGEDLYKQIEPKLNEHSVIITGKDEKYIKDDGNYIPKTRFNEIVEQKNLYKESLDEQSKQLNDLKSKLTDNESITKQIEDLQKQSKMKDDEVLTVTKKYALKDMLRDSGARYPDLLMTKFNIAELKLVDGNKIEGFEDKLKSIKEGYPDLFGKPKVDSVDDGRIPDPPKVQLTEAQRKEAWEKFPYQTKEQAERNWFDVLKKTGKI